MRIRGYLLKKHEGDYVELLKDDNFIEDLRTILRYFGMNQRGSILTPHNILKETLTQVGRYFNMLRQAKVTLESLDPDDEINNEKVSAIIQKIYEPFSFSNKLSQSGGIVVASKTMHMIMPKLFIIIDGRIMKVLHSISDYHPHINDGSWYDIIPKYYGYKLNPYPLRYNWDYFNRYFAALFYYKRIILEWCQENNSDLQSFMELDTESISFPSRVIDKALWFLGGELH